MQWIIEKLFTSQKLKVAETEFRAIIISRYRIIGYEKDARIQERQKALKPGHGANRGLTGWICMANILFLQGSLKSG